MGKRKFDVQVEEVDLPRILTECGIDPGKAELMPAVTVYKVLYAEALMFSTAAQMTEVMLREPDAAAEQHRLAELRAEFDKHKAARDTALKPYLPAAA
jgi:hypothetical protein